MMPALPVLVGEALATGDPVEAAQIDRASNTLATAQSDDDGRFAASGSGGSTSCARCRPRWRHGRVTAQIPTPRRGPIAIPAGTEMLNNHLSRGKLTGATPMRTRSPVL